MFKYIKLLPLSTFKKHTHQTNWKTAIPYIPLCTPHSTKKKNVGSCNRFFIWIVQKPLLKSTKSIIFACKTLRITLIWLIFLSFHYSRSPSSLQLIQTWSTSGFAILWLSWLRGKETHNRIRFHHATLSKQIRTDSSLRHKSKPFMCRMFSFLPRWQQAILLHFAY